MRGRGGEKERERGGRGGERVEKESGERGRERGRLKLHEVTGTQEQEQTSTSFRPFMP